MKTEVYSWRVSRELKSSLEEEARRRKLPLSAVLDLAVTEWLDKTRTNDGSGEEQKRLHASAAKYIGSFASEVVPQSTDVRQAVRERLRKRNGRR